MPLPVARAFHSTTGPSGAGKSTLLNALACRLDKGATLEGKVRLLCFAVGIPMRDL